jgi:hypothetical protein
MRSEIAACAFAMVAVSVFGQEASTKPDNTLLQLKGSARTQDRIQSGKECRKKNEHQQRKR